MLEEKMERMIASLVMALVLIGAGFCFAGDKEESKMNDRIKIWSVEAGGFVETTRIEKSDAEWKAELPPEVYRITRGHGTEMACSGAHWKNDGEGIYRCVACGTDLFVSKTKYSSGTGWPSFFEPVNEANIGTRRDMSLGMVRSEVHCERCGGHLGHVFNDGPKPTGDRYCINSLSLDFVEMDLDEQ